MRETITSVGEQNAAILAHPLRRRLLEAWSEEASATEIAGLVGESRQKVNYHAHALAKAGFLEKAGKRRKRNMWEQRYVRSTKAFVLSPEILGPLVVDASALTDRASSRFAIAMAARTQNELARLTEGAEAVEKRLPTLSIDTEVSFSSAKQRVEFATALESAIAEVIATHGGASTAKSRPYRLALSIYPKPRETNEEV